MLSDRDRVQNKSLERLFEIVVARAHETIVVTDAQIESDPGPTILFVNAAAAKRIGHPAAELIGAPFKRIVLPDMWPNVIAQLRQVAERGEAGQTELRAKDHAGKEYWMEISTLPIYDENGALEYLARIGRDVTPRKVAEQQREMTQDLLASLFGAIDVPLIVVGEGGTVMMSNVALQNALGWSLLDTTGKPLANLVAPEDRPRLDALLKGATPQPQTEQVLLQHRSGVQVQGKVQITRVKSPNRQSYLVAKIETGGANAEADSLRRHTNRPVVAGKLQLVGFSALREELGPRWTELNERVFAIADQVIRKHLQPHDICQRSGSDGFLVFFDQLDETDAQAKAVLIGEEVRRRLMGELPEGVEMQIAAYAARVSVPAGENQSEQSLLAAFSQRLEHERQRQEANAIQTVRQLLESAKPAFQRIETTDRQPAPLVMARLPGELREAIATLSSLGQPAYSVEADAFTLAGAGAHVLANLARGTLPLILVPVRFCNLATRRDIEAIVKTARSIGDAGKGQIAIEITEVPREIIRSRLADMAMRFAPLVRAIAFELPTTDQAFAMGLPMSTRLATIPIGLLRESHGAFIPGAERLVELLKARQCRLIAKGVDPVSDLPPLREAGVPMVACGA
ncbi:MAG TPA: PAS domain S-box protein [Dongiaceae bacterium]|nr:PAS domain S-box protein [Dongiaceae bacterium]